MEQIDAGGGFSVLDGAALVVGSAIASIHILGVRRWDVSVIRLDHGCDHLLLGGSDGRWAHLFILRDDSPDDCPIYPGIGDRLWAVLGIPWLATALVNRPRPALSRPQSAFGDDFDPWAGNSVSDRAHGRLEHVGDSLPPNRPPK